MDKATAQRLVRETFKAPFDRKRYRDFVNELCNGFDESKAHTMLIPDAFAPHIKSCQRLGTFTAAQGELTDILIVQLTESFKLDRTRTALRDFVAHKLKRGDGTDNSYKEAGLVAFVAPGSLSWRFSFVHMEYETKRDPKTGKIKPEERLTPARRFSYLVGADEECHTAQARFLTLLQNTTDHPALAQIEEAFSVESVTEEFFREYARLFEAAEADLASIVKRDKAIRDDFEAKGVSTVDFAKKLLGQIVFLYFIQKKGWLGVAKGRPWGDGPRNFMRLIAQRAIGANQCLFNDILEPLFYNTLATDRGEDAWCPTFQCRIPFLNGGLFEPLAGYDWEDTEIEFANTLFTNSQTSPQGDIGTGILDVFDRYNFTVNEAEPLEKEVAIDPEMLGKVFENLIEENRRKGLGAYYTPREIVHYMCQDSLISYLYRAANSRDISRTTDATVQADRLDLATIAHDTNESSLVHEQISRDDLADWIGKSDQYAHYAAAISAGTKGDHYPKPHAAIEENAQLLDDKLRDIIVCDPAIGSGAFPVGMMTEIVRARLALSPYIKDTNERTPYHFKRQAIQKCLYGVDIDRGAVEIAKLRLWLSLVVDEEDVHQIKPLPNLDYKIVSGNSLFGVEKDLFNNAQFQQLEELKPLFFDESDRSRKDKYKQQIDALIRQLTKGEPVFDYEIHFSEVFHRKGGFDIVIGNPPYIRIQNIDATEAVKLKQQYASATGKFDIYILFVEAAFQIINRTGTIVYIHPHRFLTADYGKGFKAFLDKVRGLRSAILFGVEQVFETATTYTGIFSYSASNRSIAIKHSNSSDFEALPFAERPYVLGGSHWILSSEHSGSADLVVKLKSQARQLTEVFEGIYQGIVTVGDDIFVLEGKRKGRTFVGYSVAAQSEVEIEATLVKPLVKGEHIRRYGVLDSDLGIIYPHHLDDRGRTVPYSEREMKTQFPLAYDYFKPFKKHLIEKKVKYKTNPEFWFSLHRSRDMQLFDGRKIITPQLQNMPHFTLDDSGWYPDAGGYSLVSRHSSPDDSHFLLGVLNSKVLWYFIRTTSNPYANNYYYFKTKYLEPFSLPVCSARDQQAISVLVQKVMVLRKEEPEASVAVRRIEAEIDHLVFKLYSLSAIEIQTVEEASPKMTA